MDWAIGDIYVQNTDKGLNKARGKFFRYSSFLKEIFDFFLAFNAKLDWLGNLVAFLCNVTDHKWSEIDTLFQSSTEKKIDL